MGTRVKDTECTWPLLTTKPVGTRGSSGSVFPRHGSRGEVMREGLSLRDYLAASAPVTLTEAARSCGWGENDVLFRLLSNEDRAVIMALVAMLRYEYADAMLVAREKLVMTEPVEKPEQISARSFDL